MARPAFHTVSGRVTELRAIDEGAVPTSAPATSRLFVLPVAARRWVSVDNSTTNHLHPYTTALHTAAAASTATVLRGRGFVWHGAGPHPQGANDMSCAIKDIYGRLAAM